MKQFSIDHRCDFCGQEIVYLLPDSPEEALGALSIRHTERASLLDPSTILLRSLACILSNGASGVPLVTSAIFSSNLTIRFPIFSLMSIVMLANSLAERAFLRTEPAAAS